MATFADDAAEPAWPEGVRVSAFGSVIVVGIDALRSQEDAMSIAERRGHVDVQRLRECIKALDVDHVSVPCGGFEYGLAVGMNTMINNEKGAEEEIRKQYGSLDRALDVMAMLFGAVLPQAGLPSNAAGKMPLSVQLMEFPLERPVVPQARVGPRALGHAMKKWFWLQTRAAEHDPGVTAIAAGLTIAHDLKKPAVAVGRSELVTLIRRSLACTLAEHVKRAPFARLGIVAPLAGYDVPWTDVLAFYVAALFRRHGACADILQKHVDGAFGKKAAFAESDIGQAARRVDNAVIAALRTGKLPPSETPSELAPAIAAVTSPEMSAAMDYDLARDFIQITDGELAEHVFEEEAVIVGTNLARMASRGLKTVVLLPARDYDSVTYHISNPASAQRMAELCSPPHDFDSRERYPAVAAWAAINLAAAGGLVRAVFQRRLRPLLWPVGIYFGLTMVAGTHFGGLFAQRSRLRTAFGLAGKDGTL